jgi:hypothetical protein
MNSRELYEEIRNEIETLQWVDFVIAVNSFIRGHNVEQSILFRFSNSGDDAIDPDDMIIIGFDILLTATLRDTSRHFHSGNRSDDVSVMSGESFILPSEVIYINRVFVNGRDTRFTISNREVHLSMRISETDEIRADGKVIYNRLGYDKSKEVDFPFPEHWYNVVRDYVFSELFKKAKYFNEKAYAIYRSDYERGKVMLNYPVSDYVEEYPRFPKRF